MPSPDNLKISTQLKSALDYFLKHQISLDDNEPIAAAVSGGPDSMALAQALLNHHFNNPIHIITVDHGLREASKKEALDVRNWTEQQKEKTKRNDLFFKYLKWEEAKPDNALLEQARHARYDLIESYCRQHKIKHVFLGHHKDDQVETFLIRLAKGSGLDGLAAMQSVQSYKDGLILCRPFLSISKQQLITFCHESGIQYVDDPTNENQDYLRPRLRQSMTVLESEGLTVDRLSTLTSRLRRAREALEYIAEAEYAKALLDKNKDTIRLSFKEVVKQPEEIAFRMIALTVKNLRDNFNYNIRMDKLENLFESLYHNPDNFKPRTLGGLKFALKDKNTTLWIEKEKR